MARGSHPPDRPGDHLRALENISRQLRDDMFCKFLKQAKSSGDIRTLLDEADDNQASPTAVGPNEWMGAVPPRRALRAFRHGEREALPRQRGVTCPASAASDSGAKSSSESGESPASWSK